MKLECPECGTMNEEDDILAGNYICQECGLHYRKEYCERCEEDVGAAIYNQYDKAMRCPYCNEHFSFILR